MKKILSIILCLALAFSVCSFGLTANAASGNKTVFIGYSFNGDSLFVRFEVNIENNQATKNSICVFSDPTDISIAKIKTQIVNVPGFLSVEEIFVDYLPNCDLLERIDNSCGSSTVNFSDGCTVSEFISEKTDMFELFIKNYPIDENEVKQILLNYNLINLKWFEIESDVVENITPIVDGLLSTCKKTLSSVCFYCSKVNSIDNRLFTDFKNLKSPNYIDFAGCNIWHFNDSLNINFNGVTLYNVMTQSEYCELMKNSDNALIEIMRRNFEEILLPNIVAPENISYNAAFLPTRGEVDFFYTYNNKSAWIGKLCMKYVVQADPTKDNVVDSFDVAMTTEYVNNFEEPEDEGVKIAMDVVEDGYIDATDLAYVSYIANFEG